MTEALFKNMTIFKSLTRRTTAEHRAGETPGHPTWGGGGGGVKKIIRDQRFGTGLGDDSRIRSGYTRGGGWCTPAGRIVPVFELNMPRCQGTRLAAAL